MLRISLSEESFEGLVNGEVVKAKARWSNRNKYPHAQIVEVALQDIGFDAMALGVFKAAKDKGFAGAQFLQALEILKSEKPRPLNPEIKPGDVVQIDPASDETFGGCFMQIEEVKGWGYKGFFNVPGQGRAYYRAKKENCVLVGLASWISEGT